MARTHAAYAPEFRRQMVELVQSGRSVEALAREFEPSSGAIRNWVKQADLDEGRRSDGLTTEEREELRRLRRLLGYRHLPLLRVAIQKNLGINLPESHSHAVA